MPLSASTETLDELPLIKLATKGPFASMILVADQAVQATYKWLFTQETAPKHVRSIVLAVKEELDDPKMRYHSELVDDVMHISFSSKFVDTMTVKYNDEFAIPGIILRRVCSHLLEGHFQHDSYPHQIHAGFCDYVMVKQGLISPSPDGQITDPEYVWHGRDVLPYFLDWIGREYGEERISDLLSEFRAPYDNNVFEKVTGEPISTLWTKYCLSLVKEKGGEEGSQSSES